MSAILNELSESAQTLLEQIKTMYPDHKGLQLTIESHCKLVMEKTQEAIKETADLNDECDRLQKELDESESNIKELKDDHKIAEEEWEEERDELEYQVNCLKGEYNMQGDDGEKVAIITDLKNNCSVEVLEALELIARYNNPRYLAQRHHLPHPTNVNMNVLRIPS